MNNNIMDSSQDNAGMTDMLSCCSSSLNTHRTSSSSIHHPSSSNVLVEDPLFIDSGLRHHQNDEEGKLAA